MDSRIRALSQFWIRQDEGPVRFVEKGGAPNIRSFMCQKSRVGMHYIERLSRLAEPWDKRVLIQTPVM